MANPPSHLRLTWSGVLGTRGEPVEQFTHGLSAGIGNLAVASDSTKLTVLESIADSASHEVGAFAPLVTDSVHWTNLRVALVGADGKVAKTVGGQYVQADKLIGNVDGAINSFPLPFQCALAVTLRSAIDQPWGRGRFYLPMPGAFSDQASGQITETFQGATETSAQTFLNNVNQVLEAATGDGLVIASGGSVLNGVAPGLRAVTSFSVGRVVDTIRSRRRSLDENYGAPIGLA